MRKIRAGSDADRAQQWEEQAMYGYSFLCNGAQVCASIASHSRPQCSLLLIMLAPTWRTSLARCMLLSAIQGTTNWKASGQLMGQESTNPALERLTEETAEAIMFTIGATSGDPKQAIIQLRLELSAALPRANAPGRPPRTSQGGVQSAKLKRMLPASTRALFKRRLPRRSWCATIWVAAERRCCPIGCSPALGMIWSLTHLRVERRVRKTRGPAMRERVERSARRSCYRCGKQEARKQPLQLLPGSQHITLCCACSSIVWGWHAPFCDRYPFARGLAPPRQGRLGDAGSALGRGIHHCRPGLLSRPVWCPCSRIPAPHGFGHQWVCCPHLLLCAPGR